jgi:hypothetical protein
VTVAVTETETVNSNLALRCWVKEGLGLVVHIPSGCVAKINIP